MKLKLSENSNYISYSEICEILQVDENNPVYNPKRFETIEKHINKINSIINNKAEAEEIVNFAQIGMLNYYKMIYP